MSTIAEEFDIMPEETTESISAEETADQEIQEKQEQENSDEKSGFDDMNNPDPDEFDFDDDDDEEDSNADDNEAGDEDIDTDDEESSDEEPEVQQISQEQLFQAAQAGLSLEEVNEIKDPAALNLVIKMAQNRKADGQSGNNGDKGQQEEEKPAYTFEPFKPEIPEDYDDETKALINGMAESFNKKFEEMTGIMNGLDKSSKEAESKYQQEMQQQAVNMFTEWFDNHCQSQEAWSDILGTGSIDDLNKSSDAHKNRNKLIMEMDRQAQAHPELQGDKIKLFDKALLNAFPDVYSTKKAKAKQDKITDHKQKRATQKPTGKRKKALKHVPKTKENALSVAKKAIMGFLK